MREIKFRAIEFKTEEFRCGFLYFSAGESGFQIVETIDVPPSISDPCGDMINRHYNINPQTIGEFAGLKDTKGADIYEGDIFHLGDPNILYVVEWHDTGFMGKQQRTKGSYVGLEHWRSNIEVIGNIHQNPELIQK